MLWSTTLRTFEPIAQFKNPSTLFWYKLYIEVKKKKKEIRPHLYNT